MAGFYRSGLLDKYEGCFHTVTTKESALFCQGSLALHTGEPAEEIIANRREVARRLGIGQQAYFVVAEQTHSDHITIIEGGESRGWHTAEDAVANCDAMITAQKGMVLTILTADCVPVLLFDPEKEVVAAIHAGWRGTKANITGKTVQKMVDTFGSNPKDIVAFIAPSIGRCCYEVGEDVAQHFDDEALCDQVGEKYMLDLPLANQKQLLDAGLNAENIEMSGQCTACEAERYFSYRKEQGCSGRFMSMIGLR
ncbi:peptidoglycan editing factor PgeF [Sulfurovum sp.]|jgi:YfiH family protein|uniref:peptidoglycan editing factor PgeF n=1 Tax=Sulfurovum sp. TaxID=1969726 RepID=UPI002A367A5F|nr:peptidoglycan editing factor PgeF [Sulfurovum sp.]MDD2451244.1 peptidoglycan editing factor PgeF [Sulfurovum sp.]MDD3499813.1 peptidoglycan editing factor PgeF [Sulfurovum sp.]MDY0403436.1 peptidoglycan editing factor PgeF [Sulfurovum sp.]